MNNMKDYNMYGMNYYDMDNMYYYDDEFNNVLNITIVVLCGFVFILNCIFIASLLSPKSSQNIKGLVYQLLVFVVLGYQFMAIYHVRKPLYSDNPGD